jgi:phosphomannomutase
VAHPLSLKIGLSGVRGLVGESLTPQVVTSAAAAFGTYCGAGSILVGADPRPSSEMVTQAAIAGLLSVGCTPIDVGVVPLPSLMLHVREAGAAGGIAVSGRHGPADWNALSFIDAGGLTLRSAQAAELVDLYHQGVYPRVGALEMSELRTDATTVDRHLCAVKGAVDADRIRERRLRVAIDPKGGAAAIATPRLLDALGCEVAAINAGPDARFVADPELREANLAELGDLVRRSGADVRFAQDADADRLAVVDERGTPLGADAMVALVLQRWLERRRGPIVVDVPTSRMADDVAARAGCAVHRARVGEANLLDAMREHGAEVGGESDGGVIVLPVNPCRDSLAAMAVLLEALAVSQQPVSAVRARFPRYAMVHERLQCAARDVAPSLRLVRHHFRGDTLDLTDGVKVSWPDRWLLVRPSTTEPLLRLTAEAPRDEEARALLNQMLEVLSPGI